ncbi:metallophosphoesterase family protein [Pontibacter saemangeumensis]|uniref:Metallophosphoesterase family protein n=2 Tax=Pontibacter saemangeumensis TaxID=1084525 RepID=A0ABP8LWW0_9BACT
MKRFVMSDSHGAYEALVQCIERSGFDSEEDTLFFLGDVVDGWPETMESVDLLLSIKNLVYLLGNHDQWALKYYSGQMSGAGDELYLWLTQGGDATVKSYGARKPMPAAHLELLRNAKPYHITDDHILLVHAGFDMAKPIEETATDYLIWSRDFVKDCYHQFKKQQLMHMAPYKEVYIGHTPTLSLDRSQTLPLQMGNVTLMDTGAAFSGLLSIQDIDSKQVWQSDMVMRLYPNHKGRNGMSWNELHD